MRIAITFACFSVFPVVFSQQQAILLHPNKGQWDSKIDYKIGLNQGELLLNNEGFTYVFHENIGGHHQHTDEPQSKIRCHVVKSLLLDSKWSGVKTEGKQTDYYQNYFQGKDESKWKGKVHSTHEVSYKNVYPGIHFSVFGKENNIKYEYQVNPGIDVQQIRTKIEGATKVQLREGELITTTEFGEIIEEKPVAWTIRNGKKTDVSIVFDLQENVVSYKFPNGYNSNDTLIIDPNIVFSTFTGSTMDNWGMSATPDKHGNLYAGGIVFTGAGSYPTTVGAFDVTYNGGVNYTYVWNGQTYAMNGFDVAITKFNATGTNLIYSTFLGGTENESIHSMYVDENDELFVMGVTSSADFPVTAGSFDVSFNGGPAVSINEFGFNSGADIYVTHFNAAGSGLIGSTFVGGSGTDGISQGNLYYNYGDPFRGEIIVNNGNVYVTSSSASINFPTVNAFQSSLQGPQDIIVFKMNSSLSTMLWSTFVGGVSFDSGNSVQISSSGDLFVTGGTSSPTMPFTTGYSLSYNGGIVDAYIMKMSSTTGMVLNGTYFGTNLYDQAFFVQLDQSNNVLIYGQSVGSIPITPGKYNNPNSGQFVAKFSNNLSSLLWSTRIGSGSGYVDISPTAFLVSNCNEIYLAGWGGSVNVSYSPGATHSTTNGMPITAGAYQSNTTGNNFWLSVLSQDATSLEYATFIGGTSSSYNHVDGGTSRFDKNGNIYHAVCGACGGNNFGFTTTPGAWSTSNPSFNCNLAAFKFELNTIEALVTTPTSYVCMPLPVVFSNNSSNGNIFNWNFGDGHTSNLINPSHAYAGPGQYTVSLIVSDSAHCFEPDTVIFQVNIGDFNGGVINPTVNTCPSVPVQMEAYGGSTYHWQPAQFLNNANIPNPMATVVQNTNFSCIISDSCGTDTVFVQVLVNNGSASISNDTTICVGNIVPLFANGANQITWSPPTFLDNATSLNPISTPLNSITYIAQGTQINGCTFTDTVTIYVDTAMPQPIMPDSVLYCFGGNIQISVSGGTSYSWFPTNNINPTNSSTVSINTQNNQYYYCDFSNTCGTVRDSVYIEIHTPTVVAGNDTIVCPAEPVFMFASGAVAYSWSPTVGYLLTDGSSVTANPAEPTYYVVSGTDTYGCVGKDTVFINTYPKPVVYACPDIIATIDETVQLCATSESAVIYVWSPTEFVSCNTCPDPTTHPNQPMTFTVTIYDTNGCSASDEMNVAYDALIYVPNTFTPNNDGKNEQFFALGINITGFQMEIYNRWGERIYNGDALSTMWDGTYLGKPCPDGVYTWKIEYGELFTGKRYRIVGHVNLLR